ncbi:MAG: tape measure protein [Thalassolituus sp.]|jgi:tape measure domain-containing protein
MASKIVSLLLSVKNAISPGAKDAADDLRELDKRTVELEKTLSEFDKAQDAVKTLDDTRQAATDAEAAFDSAQLEVEKLKQAFKTEKTPELGVALEKAKVAARDAKKEWQGSTKAVAQLEKVITSAGGDIKNLADTEKKFANELEFANGKLKAHSEKLSKVVGDLKGVDAGARKSSDGIKSFGAKLVGLVAGLAILDKIRDGFTSLGREVYETGNQFELFNKRLSSRELGYVTEFAKDAPQQLAGVADAFIKARTFGLDPMEGSLRALVDTNAKMGGNQETLEGIILAVGQAWSKQKLQQEEAMQLIERGIPVWDLMSQAIGKTVPELQKMSSAGQLGRREIKLLIEEMGGANAGAAADQMDTMGGLVSNLQDRFSQFYRMIADAGVWDYVKGQIKAVSRAFDEMVANGQLEVLAKKISDGFISMAETAKGFAATVYQLSGALVGLGKVWLGLKIVSWYGQLRQVAVGFSSVSAAAGSTTGAVKSLGLALRGVVGVALIQGVYSVVTAYRDLRVAVQELDASQQARMDQQAKLAAEFDKISTSTGVLVSNMADLEAQIKAGNIIVDEQAGLYLNAAQAADELAASQRDLAEAQSQVVINSDMLSGSYKTAQEGLKEAIEDNSKLASVMQSELLTALNGGVEGLGGLAIALRSVEQQGGLTSEQINDSLADALSKLSEPEQSKFGDLVGQALAQVKSGADAAGLSVEYLNRYIESLKQAKLEGALARLGTSQEELTNKITKGFQQSLSDLSVLRDAVKGLGSDSTAAGSEVYEALSGALRNVKTEADKSEFTSSITQFRNEGLITAEQYDELRNSVEDVGDTSEEMGDKGEKGGQRLQDALEGVSDAAEESSRDVRAVAAAMAGWFQGVRGEVAALSESARAAFDNRLGIDSTGPVTEIDAVKQALQGARDVLSKIGTDNLQVFDVTGVNRFKNSVLEAKNETVAAYSEQKLKALEYLDALQSGDGINQQFLTNAERSLSTMNLLGSQDLSTLRNALTAANNQLQQMSDSAEQAADNLQDELDRIRGNTEDIQQREYERAREKLQAELERAQFYGHEAAIKSTERAMRLLEQVRQEQQKKNRAQSANSASSTTSASSGGVSSGNVASSRSVDVNLNLGGNKVTLQGDPSDVDAFLDYLEDYKNRSGA